MSYDTRSFSSTNYPSFLRGFSRIVLFLHFFWNLAFQYACASRFPLYLSVLYFLKLGWGSFFFLFWISQGNFFFLDCFRRILFSISALNFSSFFVLLFLLCVHLLLCFILFFFFSSLFCIPAVRDGFPVIPCIINHSGILGNMFSVRF